MPRYSPEGDTYYDRVHQGTRVANRDFPGAELLYRRFREQDLVEGRPTPLGLRFPENSGISVNRQAYSEPQDVLEPDCCGGHTRDACVVLQFAVDDVPEQLSSPTGDYRFRMKHAPEASCFAHSEIWCNQSGDVDQPFERPAKSVREIFRAKLVQRILTSPLRFELRSESEP